MPRACGSLHREPSSPSLMWGEARGRLPFLHVFGREPKGLPSLFLLLYSRQERAGALPFVLLTREGERKPPRACAPLPPYGINEGEEGPCIETRAPSRWFDLRWSWYTATPMYSPFAVFWRPHIFFESVLEVIYSRFPGLVYTYFLGPYTQTFWSPLPIVFLEVA